MQLEQTLRMFCGWLSDKYGSRILSSIGLFISFIGLIGFMKIGQNTSTAELIVWMMIMGAGSGMFFSPNTSAIMGSVPVEKKGIARRPPDHDEQCGKRH